jgi:DNA-directed RNA polymerase subunit L
MAKIIIEEQDSKSIRLVLDGEINKLVGMLASCIVDDPKFAAMIFAAMQVILEEDTKDSLKKSINLN